MLVLYVVWSTTYLAIKVGLEAGLPPAAFVAMRSIVAGLIMLAIARARGGKLSFSRHDFKVTAIVGIFLIMGGQYWTFLAEQRISSGLASLVVALAPLWISLAEGFFPDLPTPTRRSRIGLALGFSGLLILVGPQLAGLGSGGIDLLGIGMQLTGTVLWAFGSIYSKRKNIQVDGFASTGWQMLIAGVLLAGVATLLGEWPRVTITPAGLGALAYLIVFGSCVAFSAFGYALKRLPASTVATYTFVNPGIAVLVGWVAGRLGFVTPEPIPASMAVGMVVILGGVVLTTTAPSKRRIRPEAAGPEDDNVSDELVGETP